MVDLSTCFRVLVSVLRFRHIADSHFAQKRIKAFIGLALQFVEFNAIFRAPSGHQFH